MNLKSFLKLVEIHTKLASIIPFLLGTVYTLYHFQSFKAINFLLMFGALIFIDMFTTALNNYLDYKRAVKKHGYNYESHNAIVKYNLKESVVLTVIIILFSVAVALGVMLAVNTNIIVLAVGALSFFIGICYSSGPVPISSTPLGELFSGFFMGFVILFLASFIHIYDLNVITLSIAGFGLNLYVDIIEMFYIFLLSLITVCGIANIMLANNICDIEDDIENRRYTLPIYLGREKALWLYKFIYYFAYADIIILVILRVIPFICLISLLTLIPVSKNIKSFYAEQTKKNTFVLSVKNFFLISGSFQLLFWMAWLISWFSK